MTSIHWFFTASRPVVSSFPLLSRLLTPITALRSSAIVALTWTQRFTIASSSGSSLHAGRSSRLRVLSSPHRDRINNREKILLGRSDALTQTGLLIEDPLLGLRMPILILLIFPTP